MIYRNLELDQFQEQGFHCIDESKSMIVSAPTGSGKTLLAEYAIDKALSLGKEIIYTAPIKALSNQKFRDFTHRYGEHNVGIMTGDLSFRTEAPILIMTTEIFRNAIFENPNRFNNVLYLILDEVHYLDDEDRGSVWEESIIFAPYQIKILCLSATVPNVKELAEWISSVRKEPIEVIQESKRPVPLQEMCFLDKHGIIELQNAKKFLPKKPKKMENIRSNTSILGQESGMKVILQHLCENNQLPCLYFVFSRKECERYAFTCQQYHLLSPEDQEKVANRIQEMKKAYNLPSLMGEKSLGKLLRQGIAYHHAGMIPAFKEIVEQLFTDGLIKLLFATETFALGVNMPARSVVFHALKKFDGIELRRLKGLEYQQMSGRAGRRGIDSVGYIYANLGGDTISSTELKKMTSDALEPICSRFNLSYSTILSLYDRLGEGVLTTCQKSLGHYHVSQLLQQKNGRNLKRKFLNEQKWLIKTKLSLLTTLGYIKDSELTSKGRFAILINGYEIQLTELFYNGFFEGKTANELFVTLVALVYEGKKFERSPFLPKPLYNLALQVDKILWHVYRLEKMLGIEVGIAQPHFQLSIAANAWVSGCHFSALKQYTSIPSGDLVRTFRQAIQLCRQLKKACHGYESFTQILDQCTIAVNRDEINALNQLQAFAGIQNSSTTTTTK